MINRVCYRKTHSSEHYLQLLSFAIGVFNILAQWRKRETGYVKGELGL
jgi:hypothetical protein